ncbi:hypothetical protein FA95DRAFT_1612436 [Auriscalpium vulgare]|uniref:Uncharacterized protein n=1 Tax=Auriscalpium vulgare TaxID=40419 RepID=A0ACB8R6M6_9AGAM|nr:hypothetical protein FA95DRAFT_1612436 [Auriscalpium vulgare]
MFRPSWNVPAARSLRFLTASVTVPQWTRGLQDSHRPIIALHLELTTFLRTWTINANRTYMYSKEPGSTPPHGIARTRSAARFNQPPSHMPKQSPQRAKDTQADVHALSLPPDLATGHPLPEFAWAKALGKGSCALESGGAWRDLQRAG